MSLLADTSAWIEFLRATDSQTHHKLREALADGPISTTDPIVMELLAGARTDTEERRLFALLGIAQRIPCEFADHLEAARLFRTCRAGGDTVRSMSDCLIAAVAVRVGLPVLHADRDFDSIARHSALVTA